MESPVKERATIDIGVTSNGNRNIIPSMFAAHTLTGSDTSAGKFG